MQLAVAARVLFKHDGTTIHASAPAEDIGARCFLDQEPVAFSSPRMAWTKYAKRAGLGDHGSGRGFTPPCVGTGRSPLVLPWCVRSPHRIGPCGRVAGSQKR